MVPSQQAELAGDLDGLETDLGEGRFAVELHRRKGWTCKEERDLGGGQGQHILLGKLPSVKGDKRGQLLRSDREPEDKGDNKAGRAWAHQPGLVPQCPTT